MKRLIILFLTCVICQVAAYAQKDSAEVSYRLSGHITNAQTGEPVWFATVQDCEGQILGESDKDGFYCLDLHAGPHKLQFAALGYKSNNAEVNLDQRAKLYFQDQIHAVYSCPVFPFDRFRRHK